MGGKKENQIRHAQQRARQRFGLSKNAIEQLTKDIQQQKCKLLEKQSPIKTAWYAVVEEMEVVAIYDSRRHVIVTLFPYDWWKETHCFTNSSATNEKQPRKPWEKSLDF